MATSRLIEFVCGAWRKLPVETLVVAVAAAGAIGLVHVNNEVWFLRLLLAGLLVTPLAFAAHRLGRRTQALSVLVAAAGVLAALAAALPSVHAFDAPTFGWRYGLALLAATLVPFVASARHFTRFVRRFFEETTTWGLLCGAALAALAIVVVALQELFDLSIQREAVDAAILLISGFVLVYLHRLLAEDASPGRMPELWRRLATAIGAPFVSVMLVILVVYEISALVHGELPRNTLSPLIIAAGFAGFVSTLIIASVLREDVGTAVLTPADPHAWTRRGSVRLARAFPLVLVALLPMAGWALWLRIEQYGVTPFRAVRGMGLLCLTALSVLGAIRWLRGRATLGWEVPAAIIVFAVATAFGPTSAIELSIASQARGLAARLDAAGAPRVVGASTGAPRIDIERADYDALRDGISDLAQLGGEPALRRLLSGAVERCSARWQADQCLDGLGVHPRDIEPPPIAAVVAPIVPSVTTVVSWGRVPTEPGTLAFFDVHRLRGQPTPVLDATNAVGLTADSVAIYAGGAAVAAASLAPLMRDATSGDALISGAMSIRWIPLRSADGKLVARLAIQRLDVERETPVAPGDVTVAAPPEVTHVSGVVVWPR